MSGASIFLQREGSDPGCELVDPEKVVFIQPGIAGGELGGLVG
jgi:hypothetical protein